MLAKKLFYGAYYQVISWVISILISFLMTPFVIAHLGNDTYGLWILAASIFSFYGVLDFGLSVATQRAITQSIAVDDTNGANSAVVTSLVIFLGLGLLAAILTLIISALGGMIVKDPALIGEFRWVVLLLGMSIAAIFPTYAISGIYAANFRVDLSSNIHLVKFLTRSLLIYLALQAGFGVVVMAAITAATDVVAAIFMIYFARKLAPWLFFRPQFFNTAKLREMFSFGSAFLFFTLCEKGKNSLPSFAMNATVGLSGVTFYGVAQQFYDYFSRLIGSVISVFQPLFIKQQSSDQHAANSSDFIFVMELSLCISIVLAGGIIGCAPDFFHVWLGPEFEKSLGPLYILIVAGIFSVGAQPATQLIFAYARQNQLAAISLIEVAVSAIAIFPAAHYAGLMGVAAAVAIPAVVSKLIIHPLFVHKALSFNYWEYLLLVARSVLIVVFMFLILKNMGKYVPGNGYIKVLLLGCISIAVSLPLTFFLGLGGTTRRRLLTFSKGMLFRR